MESTIMKIPTFPFTVTDWRTMPAIRQAGEHGYALTRTLVIADMTVRMVDYSPGYLADHWCARGHIVLVVAGDVTMELTDGQRFVLSPEMSFQVSDDETSRHRASTQDGATVFVID